MEQIQNSLFDTMKIFIDNCEKKSTATYTVEAEIDDIINENTGEYLVKYQTNKFNAYSLCGIKYKKGDIVYILIHNNDFSKTKTILSLVSPSKNQIDFSNFELCEIIDSNGRKKKALCLKE